MKDRLWSVVREMAKEGTGEPLQRPVSPVSLIITTTTTSSYIVSKRARAGLARQLLLQRRQLSCSSSAFLPRQHFSCPRPGGFLSKRGERENSFRSLSWIAGWANLSSHWRGELAASAADGADGGSSAHCSATVVYTEATAEPAAAAAHRLHSSHCRSLSLPFIVEFRFTCLLYYHLPSFSSRKGKARRSEA